ncbi:rhodanese-like domain-containing protein [Candidatus Parabeggiatoa sp. HSG14]|uniref:rhodanese-like domain-containing protein n=1 Tax=Candidatus Parabeggiatoa sp. HSG14 TaxID=3055593 RepID=UPI0025A871C0|nr:rhodanese-like domain-containing protein [Thiotrichales bacterium HSG14]
MEQQLIEFVGNHPELFLALAIITGLLVWNLLGDQITGVKPLLAQQATLLINHDNAIVLDVREENEYTQGHILNSIHIPLNTLSEKIARLEKYRNRPIIVNCMSGNRSAQACRTLKKNGFEDVHNLKGGIIAWQNASLPLTKGKNNSK